MDAKEIKARIFAKKSLRWIYDHAPELGGVKIGGSWLFTMEGLNSALQGRETVEGKGHYQWPKKNSIVPNQKRSVRVGKSKSQGIEAIKEVDKYGLLA
jgi:hypothetical protein